MGKRIRKIKNIRIHREGTNTLAYTAIGMALVGVLFWYVFDIGIVFDVLVCLMAVVYGVMVNFFRCPIRYFNGDDTEGIVVAPADGKVVVIEEVEEDTYFHDRRMMVSIFMSLFNVHANWFPVDGKVKFVKHHDGNFHKAWLPKASEENERADVLIETEDGEEVLCRQVAGAVARRIVTYAKDGEDCFIDEHLGFIKFGSRVDVFLPLGSKVCVKMGQSTTGDQTVIAMLPAKH
jgi:phosphatidylserine decarboxylase